MVSILKQRFTGLSQEDLNLEDCVPYAQFFCDPVTGSIKGAEILARLRNAETNEISASGAFLKTIPPGDFADLDLHMLEQACIFSNQMKEVAGHGREVPFVSVNLTVDTLSLPDLSSRVSQILARHGVMPQDIKFEILEHAFPEKWLDVGVNISRLAQAGHPVDLDDFLDEESDFDRLEYLADYITGVKFPLSFQKLDPAACDEITQAIKLNGLQFTVEHVEDPVQLHIAHRTGCNLVQGNLFYKPASLETALETYRQHLGQPLSQPHLPFDEHENACQPEIHAAVA